PAEPSCAALSSSGGIAATGVASGLKPDSGVTPPIESPSGLPCAAAIANGSSAPCESVDPSILGILCAGYALVRWFSKSSSARLIDDGALVSGGGIDTGPAEANGSSAGPSNGAVAASTCCVCVGIGGGGGGGAATGGGAGGKLKSSAVVSGTGGAS